VKTTWRKALVAVLMGILGSAAVVGVWMIPMKVSASDASMLYCEYADADCWRTQAQIQIEEVQRLTKQVGDLKQRLKISQEDASYQRQHRLACVQAINSIGRIMKWDQKKEGQGDGHP
jgi:Tfp pilus assembly protein PilN